MSCARCCRIRESREKRTPSSPRPRVQCAHGNCFRRRRARACLASCHTTPPCLRAPEYAAGRDFAVAPWCAATCGRAIGPGLPSASLHRQASRAGEHSQQYGPYRRRIGVSRGWRRRFDGSPATCGGLGHSRRCHDSHSHVSPRSALSLSLIDRSFPRSVGS